MDSERKILLVDDHDLVRFGTSLLLESLEDVRCFHRARVELHPRHNLIWGNNGSGKTSLLESIFLLGRGRSFRTRNSERLIRHGEPMLTVFGRTGEAIPRAIGVQVSRTEGTLARIDGVNASALAELSATFPVQIIDPGVHKLVEEGAGFTTLPFCSAYRRLREGRVCLAPIEGVEVSWTLIQAREQPLSTAGERMKSLLRDVATERVAAGEWKLCRVAP